MTMVRHLHYLALILALLGFSDVGYAEGSKNLAPDSTGTADGTNTINGMFIHNDGNTGDFFHPDAVADERLYVYMKDGETLHMGFRGKDQNTGAGITNIGDMNIMVRANDGTLVTTFMIERANTGDENFIMPQDGAIESYAECLAGPRSIVGASGYRDLVYTNNTGADQSFYVSALITTANSSASVTTDPSDPDVVAVNQDACYDLWDFSVYDGSEEKTGRVYSKWWCLNSRSTAYEFSQDLNLYVAVPSAIGGVDAGYYIKVMELGGMRPFVVNIYANSEGSQLAETSDVNLDGTVDFLDQRRSIDGGGTAATYEYDIFLNNPDIEIWPTTTLPTVNITDAIFYCNAAGDGGEAAVTFVTNSSGFVSLIIDMNGTPGYDVGTEDVILEEEVDASSGSATVTMRWDGVNGLGITVPSGTQTTITGRFTAGPFHLPMYDPEYNLVGINMEDVRPQTSFDLVYWDDRDSGVEYGGDESLQLTGTDVDQHLWDGNSGNNRLVNTWSFGYYKANTQDVPFVYICDYDGDGISTYDDLDNDNDGVTDAVEGDWLADADGDDIPDYLDSDVAGFTDSNDDGINDVYDTDLDGIPDAVDVDSDNDGIPDMVENGLTDGDGDGTVDEGSGITDTDNDGLHDTYDDDNGGATLTIIDTDSDGVNNYIDLDSDDDGIVDVIEAGGDADPTTGQILGFDDTDNGNGWNDFQESIPLTDADTDADGFEDRLDIDSDDDGITDNVESQSSTGYAAPSGNDTDGNGLDDLFDPNNSGTLIDPEDTDGDNDADYVDTDTDGDGVEDYIEGWDVDSNGLMDEEASSLDNDLADEIGYQDDADSDGLWDIYENGGPAPIQNTDGADEPDWRDTDDDDDGTLTAGEDANLDMDWSNDESQGQVSGTPDYLYRGDYDGDGTNDSDDADSDNDGITDVTEQNGAALSPKGDNDGDGVPNYRDDDDFPLLSLSDDNGDGVWDIYDSDRDGVPDYLDLDSDNDGIWDAIEANGGSVATGLDINTGQFQLDDPDGDGLMNDVDTDDATDNNPTSSLPNPDTDGDGTYDDYRDIDSDGDGITDNVEAQSSAGYIAPSGEDTDSDGIDDSYDADNGGVRLDPENTDGTDNQDYRDTDSDNDNVLDIVEGDDTDEDGFGDWDSDEDGDFTDETDYNTDSDGDGLTDIFDTETNTGAVSNLTATNADLQNTDKLDERDWRDTNDDNDNVLTENEDANTNGDYADDFTNGQASGTNPDYLFTGDFDNDGVVDINDADSDNDGVPDLDEDNGETVDPSGDEDGDGVLNFRDFSDTDVSTNLSSTTDANNDGVYDVFDTDLDGTPNFRDHDSDNDGIADIVEARGTDADGDGADDSMRDDDGDAIPNSADVDFTGGDDVDGDGIDDSFDASETGNPDDDGDGIQNSSDPDRDGDGLTDTYDADNTDENVFTSTIENPDTDGNGDPDIADIDSDDDGIPDLFEAGGTDVDGDGHVDSSTDSDADGFVDTYDTDNGGTPVSIPDTDNDLIADYLDSDSDNDGIPDPIESGGTDTDSDGIIDDSGTDSDGDGLADSVDPDSGGTPLSNVDTDRDGIADFRDLDADNDALPDVIEAGGTDANGDGLVDTWADSDGDGIPDAVDQDQFATNGGSGLDTDNDEIDDSFDVDETGGNDDDGDGIDNTFDNDEDGDGYDDATEADPYGQNDLEGDGLKNFRDLDSDGDGIPDVVENGETADPDTVTIDNFTDVNNNGWNDAQDATAGGTPITAPDSDADGLDDYLDIDSDDDGIPDNIEAQTKLTYIGIADTDADGDGLDDNYDPNDGGTLIEPVNTDGDANEDYLDTDSDDDNVPDAVEGDNEDKKAIR